MEQDNTPIHVAQKRRNNGKEWTEDDLLLLSKLVQDKVQMKYMKQILGRSEYAIKHAFRNTMFHHLIDHHPEVVASRYKMSTDDLATNVVPIKYSIPLPQRDDSDTEYSSSDENENSRRNYNKSCIGSDYVIALGVFFALCAGGFGYYATTLCREWNALTMSS